MQPFHPEQATFLLNTVFLPSIQNEHRITKSMFEAIPLDKGDYRPNEVSKSALDLAWHIASTEMRFLDAIAEGEFNFAPMPRPDSVTNSAELTSWYVDHFGPRLQKVIELSPEQLLKMIDFRGMFNLPAVMYLNFVLQHSTHHRGQLSMYLRPVGAKVPSIYGESYDAAEARKAAAKTA